MECVDFLQQMLRCKFSGIDGQSIQFLHPLASTRFTIWTMVRFLFNRGWVNHKLHNTSVEGKNEMDHWVGIRHFTDNPFKWIFQTTVPKPQDGRSRNTGSLDGQKAICIVLFLGHLKCRHEPTLLWHRSLLIWLTGLNIRTPCHEREKWK